MEQANLFGQHWYGVTAIKQSEGLSDARWSRLASGRMRPQAEFPFLMFSWLQKTPPFEHPQLGRLIRTGKFWRPSQRTGTLGVVIEGGQDCPIPEGITIACQLLENATSLVPVAQAFVRSDSRAVSFMEGQGVLECDGFTVYQTGDFAVEFSLTGWPDAMISVPFKYGAPFAVELGD